MRSERFLFAVVFLAGVGTLGIEMVMSRMIAPFFGTSQLIWAVVIGMTLVYLALGYELGGRLADRYPQERVLYQLIAWAGLLTGCIPLIANPVLRTAQQALDEFAAGGFIGAFVGVVLLFSLPVTLMAMVGPFAVKLQLRRLEQGITRAGRTAGAVSSLSTIGSILGTFLSVLLLIPAIGTAGTTFLLAGFLIVLGIVGLRDWRYLVMLLILGLLIGVNRVTQPTIKAADCRDCRILAEVESSINYIQVAQQDFLYQDPYDPNGTILDQRVNLILNEGQAIHSIYRLRYRESGDPVDLLTDGGPWDLFAVAPYLVANRNPAEVRSMAMIGSAAGTVPKQFLAIYGPDTRIDAVEIDAAIVELGRRYFDLEDLDPNFPAYTTYVQDGRYWLATLPDAARYDLIAMDAYHQPYIPFHLTTVEFFQQAYAHLEDDGVVVVNAGRGPSGDDRLVNALAGTMRTVFPQVFMIETQRGANTMLVGVRQAVGDGRANFIANRIRVRQEVLAIVMDWAIDGGPWGSIREFQPEEARYAPFTDDHAPVEQLIDQLILDEYVRLR